MLLKHLGVLFLLAAGAALAQQSNYIEIYAAKVRPDRMAEFDAGTRKMADANRKAKDKGDYWIAYETMYGEGGNVYFVSPRTDMSSIEPAGAKFVSAIQEYTGMTPDKFFADLLRNISSSRMELHRRRWDLSWNVPKDPADMVKEAATARFARVISMQVKTGRMPDLERTVLMLKKAAEAADNKATTYIDEDQFGSAAGIHVVAFAPDLGTLEKRPTLKSLLGESGANEFMQKIGEATDHSETMLLMVKPEWSNVPKMIADANPSFWNPKPAAAKPKPAAAKAEPAKSGL